MEELKQQPGKMGLTCFEEQGPRALACPQFQQLCAPKWSHLIQVTHSPQRFPMNGLTVCQRRTMALGFLMTNQ